MSRNRIFISVQIFVLINFVSVQSNQAPLVNTTLGLVRGLKADDGDYYKYLGMPYGKVDENNPFGAASPHPEYNGILEANDDTAMCPQLEEFNLTISGTLDCLHANVFVSTSASPSNLLPVLVWIYGGAFEFGFYGQFLYGPKFIVRHDIVFVVFNYRTGPFGFMCLDTPEVPGNQGLKDQLLALKWVHENIANFGGDPNKVTIAGNSAGGSSVELQMFKESEQKLFHKAILQSGTAFTSITTSVPLNPSLRMAQHLGFETNDVSQSISFLAKVDPLLIIEAGIDLGLQFGLCVEKKFEGVDAFITEDVNKVTKIPDIKDMPILIGFTNDEGHTASPLFSIIGRWVSIFLMSSVFNSAHPRFINITTSVDNFYIGDEEINEDNIQGSKDIFGDSLFIYPSYRSIERFLNNDAGDIYLYMFSYDGERNFVKHRENMPGGLGAGHADEVGYLFDISYMDVPSAKDQVIVDRMTTLWANFVKYSNPTPITTDLLPYTWQPITKTSPYYYFDIDEEPRVGNRPFHDRMAYWDLLFETFGDLEMGTPSNDINSNQLINKLLRYL